MILHIDDRLLHGRILHGWDRGEVKRFVLLSRRLRDPDLRRLYDENAKKPVLCLPMEGEAPPRPETGDFWLADHPEAAAYLMDRGAQVEALHIIALRQDGEPLREDLSPDTSTLVLLEDLRRRGLKLGYRPFPDSPTEDWPPERAKTP